MADLKISQLNSLAGSSLANNDVLAVVDTSASETKKITSKDLVQYGYALVDPNTLDGNVIEPGTTSARGTVQLTDSTGSTSTTTAATPNAVKGAYDLANAALPKSGGTMTGQILGDDSTSASTPGYAFDGDPDTGLLRTGANELGLVTGGTARLTVDASGNVVVPGNFTVQGTTTTIDTTTLVVEDKNIEMGAVATPSDVTADGGGITLRGTTDKTINWIDATDAWTSSERFSVPAGTAGAPSLTFTGDPNTGIYSPGADQVAISTGGSGKLFVDASGNVGVGTSTPNAAVEAANGNFLSRNFGTASNFICETAGGTFGSPTAISTQTTLANYTGRGYDGTVYRNVARVAVWNDGAITSTSSPGFLWFGTTPSGSTSLVERLRITSAGLVGVGTSSPSQNLHVASTGNTKLLVSSSFSGSTDTGIFVDTTGDTSVGSFSFLKAGVSRGDIAYRHNASGGSERLALNVAGGERLSVLGSGNVGIGTTSPAHAITVNSGSISISNRGSGNSYLFPDWRIYNSSSGNALVFDNYTTEAFRVDSSNRLLVGTSSARTLKTPEPAGGNDISPFFQLEGTGGSNNQARGAAFVYNNGDVYGPALFFGKTRGTTNGSFTIPSQNDAYGSITFQGADGTKFVEAGSIRAEVDGTPGANDMPGRLVLSTTADGASSPTERMRITSAGLVGIGTTSPVYPLSVIGPGATPGRVYIGNTLEGLASGTNNGGAIYFGVDPTSATAPTAAIESSWGGGTTPQIHMGVTRDGTKSRISFSADNTARIYTTNTERFRIDASGTVNVIAPSSTVPFIASIGGSEVSRIDSSGRLLVGTSSALAAGNWSDSLIQVRGNSSGSTFEGKLALFTGRTIAAGIGAGETLGRVAYGNGEGGEAAWISAQADAGWSANDYPGRLVFSTTADGASSPTERLRITSAGVLQVADAGNIAVGTTTGTKIGTATTQKLGFFNKTPVVQPAAVADATDAASVITQLNALLARMRDLGLIAT